VHIAEVLTRGGYELLVVEPNIESHESLHLVKLEEALRSADILAIMVKHRQFLHEPIKELLRAQGALDFCGALA
jgi:UDP-N-acetyl-D-mannosaminuronic acid dehydrogenase